MDKYYIKETICNGKYHIATPNFEESDWGVIDNEDNIILDFNYIDILESVNTSPITFTVSQNLNEIHENGRFLKKYNVFQISNLDGKAYEVQNISQQNFEYISGFDNGLAIVIKDNFGIINNNGDIVSPEGLTYKSIESFYYQDLTFVNVKDRHGLNRIMNITKLEGYLGVPALSLTDHEVNNRLFKKNEIVKSVGCENFMKYRQLDNIELGKITYLIGKNNAGKSTFIKLICLAKANIIGVSKSKSKGFNYAFSVEFEDYQGLINNTFEDSITHGANGEMKINIGIGNVIFSVTIDNYIITNVLVRHIPSGMVIAYNLNFITLQYRENIYTVNSSELEYDSTPFYIFLLNNIKKRIIDEGLSYLSTFSEFENDLNNSVYSNQHIHIISSDVDITEHIAFICLVKQKRSSC